MCWGLDLSAKCSGYAAGDGSRTPECDAWQHEQVGNDYGRLLRAFRDDLNRLADRLPPTHVIYEAPLLLKWDKLPTLRRIYPMGSFLELWCIDHGVICQEEDPKALKKRLTGDSYAKKKDMVRVAKAMGVRLPPGPPDGPAGDAADGYAAWLVCIQHHCKEHLPMWDAALLQRRGALL